MQSESVGVRRDVRSWESFLFAFTTQIFPLGLIALVNHPGDAEKKNNPR